MAKSKKNFDRAQLKSSLSRMSEEKFFDAMIRKFSGDANTERMEVAIQVMQKRFPQFSKADQLTWALTTAAKEGNLPMIDFLLDQGALINGTQQAYVPGLLGRGKFDPMWTAVHDGPEDAVKHLLKKGANPDPEGGRSYLSTAAFMKESFSLTRILLNAGTKSGGNRAFYGALITRKNLKMAELLLDGGVVDLTADNYQIGRSAIIRINGKHEGGREILDFLLAKGLDMEAVAQAFETADARRRDSAELAQLARDTTAAYKASAKRPHTGRIKPRR